MNHFARPLQLAHRAACRLGGVAIVYRRITDAGQVLELRLDKSHVAIGRTEFIGQDNEGVLEKWHSRDYLLEAADLVLGGQRTLPQIGDEIDEFEGSVKRTYQVLETPEGPGYKFRDQFRTLLRVFTKEVPSS